MTKPAMKQKAPLRTLSKAPTGITGLDEITGGGFPRGRPTLVCGSAGCGKTLMAMEFLVRGAIEHGEPGVFVTFEELPEELTDNVRSLGFDLQDLESRGLLLLEHIHVERSEIEETGEYDLEAWREQSSVSFSLRMFPGDHFFLNATQSVLLRLLSQELRGDG